MKTRYGVEIIMCAKCGVPNKSDAKFCMNCGSPLTGDVLSKTKTCPACNTRVKEGAKFCMRCGGKIENEKRI